MPSTIKINDTLTWASAFILQRPSFGVVGANEPGLTCANKIIQSIVAAPFRWNWNRVEKQNVVTTAQGVADYTVALADFGYLEKATIFNGQNDPPMMELEVFPNLAREGKNNQPQKICAFVDDGQGNITFRVMPAADQPYQISLIYQKSVGLAVDLNAKWSPIPDKYAFLYEIGMLAHLQGMYNAQLYSFNMEMFFRQLVGAAEGLSESERAIFLEDRLRDLKSQTSAALSAQHDVVDVM